jgi:lipoprotein NlpI/transglutaminase-like putative cysteine protease
MSPAARWIALTLAGLIAAPYAPAFGQAGTPGPAGQPAMKEVQVAQEAFARGAPPPDWVEAVAVPESSRKPVLLVRLADTQTLVRPTPATFVHRAIQSNDASTLKKIGEFAISFVPDYQRLALHSIVVLRGAERLDRTQSANIRFLQPASELSNSVYTSSIAAAVLIDDVRVGDTVEYSYTIAGANPVFEGKYFGGAGWDSETPVDLRRVVLSAPESRPIAWKSIGDFGPPVPDPKISLRDGVRTLRFEERSLEPITVEPLTPNSYAPYRWIQFSEFASWAEVDVWAGGLFPHQSATAPEFTALVAKLQALPTREARLSEALAFSQRELRYFSLSFGESSHRPAAPDVVLQRRFGDCKDKSYFLITLLDALGIEAHPVLLSLQRKSRQEVLLPSPGLFDHAIVEAKIDDKVYFVDPTIFEQKGRIDRIGQAHERAQVLVVGGAATGLTSIPASPEDLHASEQHDEAALKSLDGEGELVSKQILTGMRAALLRLALASVERKTLEKEISASFEKTYPGAVLSGPLQIEDDTELNRLVVTCRLRVPGFARKADKAWLIPYRPENLMGIANPQVSGQRTFPMQIQSFPLRARYTFELELPEQVAAIRDPSTRRLNGAFFDYSVTQSFRGNRARVEIDFRALVDEVPAKKVSEYSADVRKLSEFSRWVVVVGPDDFKKSGFLGIGEKSLRETLSARMRDQISKYTASIKSEKLGGADLAKAYCERSAAYDALSEFDKALEDANRAVELAPDDAEMLGCRAETYLSSGDFQHAASDASRAVLLGEGASEYLRKRGQARFYLKQFADAADDLTRASSLEHDAGMQSYTDLWAICAYQRAGKPLPEDVARRAGAHPQGDWPLPALAMVTGKLSPEEMLKIVNQKTGDELAMTQTEAYFYLGQRYVALGDRANARQAFERVRSLGVLMYIEYTAAGFELKDLGEAAH